MGWLHGVKTTHNNHVYTKLSTNISPSKRKTTRTTQQQNFWVYEFSGEELAGEDDRKRRRCGGDGREVLELVFLFTKVAKAVVSCKTEL
jgi:hypothetical protein